MLQAIRRHVLLIALLFLALEWVLYAKFSSTGYRTDSFLHILLLGLIESIAFYFFCYLMEYIHDNGHKKAIDVVAAVAGNNSFHRPSYC